VQAPSLVRYGRSAGEQVLRLAIQRNHSCVYLQVASAFRRCLRGIHGRHILNRKPCLGRAANSGTGSYSTRTDDNRSGAAVAAEEAARLPVASHPVTCQPTTEGCKALLALSGKNAFFHDSVYTHVSGADGRGGTADIAESPASSLHQSNFMSLSAD
jgi:hypothetical protein